MKRDVDNLLAGLLDCCPEAGCERVLELCLEHLDPAEPPPPAILALAAGFADKWPRRLPEKPSRADLNRISILLRRGGLAIDDLATLAAAPGHGALSCEALAAAAQSALETHPELALQFLRSASARLTSTTTLQALSGLAETLALNPSVAAKLPTARVAFIGNCTLKYAIDAFKVGLLAQGVRPMTWEAPFDQWARQLSDEQSELYRFEPSFVVLYLSSLGLTRAGTIESMQELELLEMGLRRFRLLSSARLVILLPDPLIEEWSFSSRLTAWRKAFTSELKRIAGEDAVFVDPVPLAMEASWEGWFAPRFWHHAKLPCHPGAMLLIGRELALTVARLICLPVKVVVCDCDNTLWGGVVGEDGWENLELDVHGAGAAFVRLHAFLRELAAKGVLLAIVTKNNEADVKEVFEKRRELGLRLEDFIMVLSNWQPKSENIAHLAKTLNLGLKNFCFLDDSPFERLEVRAALPEVIVPELPRSPDEYIPFLVKSGLFHIPAVTSEDLARTDMYRKDFARQALQNQAGSLDGFLASLELRVTAMRIGGENMNRIVQLINKTNQFNLTTRRHVFEDVKRMSEDADVFAYGYRVEDRFGDSGITGVLIALPEGVGCYAIDTFLLSCRVIGRTIERALFAHLVGWLRARNVSRLRGALIPSGRNAVVSSLLPELGFVPDGEGAFVYDLAVDYTGNAFVRLTD